MGVQTDTYEEIDTDVLIGLEKQFQIVVWNDDVNTFDWVIETLIKVCGHTQEQAEQCALFIHTKGKYAVKKGDYDDLKPQTDAITERGIDATLEVTA
jgi:ATP-dependent Clp protease adaptor protein ClpS